ncbi:two-component regulator propeller domain-containing protein [Flammeovirga sp. OC4]|uniref:two-component regulator propeller domain-containing protein n=1 Tax=Flammeovirga sp. OC4 TaxID=1382345 RepID=UPI000AAB018F|nr:two-component regulator propeller domain-containing protein [Flammeovirga sp. OC4]
MKLLLHHILLAILLLSTTCYANTKDLIFNHYTTRHGLSQNDINCLYQDSQGLLWIGTNDGFSSFDGYEFKDYRKNTHNIPTNIINRIVEDQFGNLWLGTADAGICRFNLETEEFTAFMNSKETPKLFTKNNASRMVLDAEGNLWFGNSKGLNCVKKKYLNKDQIEVNKYQANPHNKESLLQDHVRDIYIDADGNLWIGTLKGLQKFIPPTGNKDYGTFKSYPNTASKNNGILGITESDNALIIAYYNGIYEVTKEGDKPEDFKFKKLSDLRSDYVLCDNQNNVWAGTKAGLFRMKLGPQKDKLVVLEHYDKDEYLNTNIIHMIYEDKTGIVWIGTNGGGIKKYNPKRKKFQHIKKERDQKSLSYNKVRSVFEDSYGRLWVGTEGGGLNYLEPNSTEFKKMNVATGIRGQNMIYDIEEWNGQLIFGVGYPLRSLAIPIEKAHLLEKQLWKSSFFHPANLKNSVFSIETDGDSTIWLASYGGGLTRGILQKNNSILWKKIDIQQTEEYKDPFEVIRSLLVDSKGNLWVGSNQGLIIIPKEEKLKDRPDFKLFISDDDDNTSLSYNYVLPMYETSNGEIWIGTMGGGLNVVTADYDINSIKFDRITVNDGLPNNAIKAILEDNYGNVWVSSNKGISKISIKNRTIKNFDASDGLQDDEFGELTACKRKNGELVFGGVNGINVFNPHEIVDDITNADLVFTELKILNNVISPADEDNDILNKSIRYTKSITIDANQNSFSVKFAYLHYASPNKNSYKYKLVGLDKNWVTADAMQREAKYTNLYPGEYTLLVKASNGDNIWKSDPIDLKITILPPWWMTWWAKLMYFVIFVGLVYFFSRFTIITARRKSQLEMVKFENEKLEDLSQLKMQFFTNISHELRTPLTLINTPIEQLIKKGRELSEYDREKSYQLIHKNIQHLMRLVNQLLDFRKVEQGKMKLNLTRGNWNTFIEQIYFSFKEFSEQTNINYTFQKTDDNIHGLIDTDKVEKILYNLLSNAFKFTTDGEINLSIKQENDRILITLQDTGIGIPKERQQHLFERFYQVDNLKRARHRGTGIGLAFTKSLVDLHHGEITLESEQNKGTTFFLSFPINDDAYDGEFIEETPKEETKSLIEDEEYLETSTKAKIVVIDDNLSIRELLKDLLKDTYDVFLAENGAKGLELAKEVMPNLILSDIMMPVMDGYELTKKVREDNQICHLPIILLTAKKSEESKLKGYEYGVDAYVTKPFNSDVLLARIFTIIENRRNQQKRFRVDVDIQPSEITFTTIDEKFLNRLVEIVEENISDSEFTVEKLALEYGATPLRLNQKLKALTGQTAKGFIRNIRLKRAAQMLKLGRFSVSGVTYEVGFNDLKYFRNCFKKEFGVLPSQYAKEIEADKMP